MKKLYAINFDAGSHCFRVDGELSLDTVSAVVEESGRLFSSVQQLDIDLIDVTKADSAALALLITWMRNAKEANQTISFRNLPPQMLAIAKASSLDSILPIT